MRRLFKGAEVSSVLNRDKSNRERTISGCHYVGEFMGSDLRFISDVPMSAIRFSKGSPATNAKIRCVSQKVEERCPAVVAYVELPEVVTAVTLSHSDRGQSHPSLKASSISASESPVVLCGLLAETNNWLQDQRSFAISFAIVGSPNVLMFPGPLVALVLYLSGSQLCSMLCRISRRSLSVSWSQPGIAGARKNVKSDSPLLVSVSPALSVLSHLRQSNRNVLFYLSVSVTYGSHYALNNEKNSAFEA